MKSDLGYLLIAVAIAVVVGVYLVYSSSQGFPAPEDFSFEAQVYKDGSSSESNFAETGVLIINNPGLKEDTFYLVYEKPGAPALSQELSFESVTDCFSGARVDCSVIEGLGDELAGKRARVVGYEDDDGVAVKEIYFVDEDLDL